MTGDVTSRQIVPKSPACPEGLFLMDGIEGLRSLPKHSVDMLLTDPPYGTTRNFWDVPLPLPELWEAVKWAVKPDGAVLFFAQCPYDKVLGASNLSMLRYEWVWYKSRCTGFLNARRAPLKRTENILVFYQKLPYYDPQFEQGKPYKKISRTGDNSPNYGKFLRSSSGSEDGLRFPGNLLAFSSVQRTVHPTQKPVELCEYLIRTYAVFLFVCHRIPENGCDFTVLCSPKLCLLRYVSAENTGVPINLPILFHRLPFCLPLEAVFISAVPLSNPHDRPRHGRGRFSFAGASCGACCRCAEL